MSNLTDFVGGKSQRYQLFTESGTWVCPNPDTMVRAIAIGGGGGGAGAGSTSSFGSLVSAAGGGVCSDAGGTGSAQGTPGATLPRNTSYEYACAGSAGGPGFMGFGGGGSGRSGVMNTGSGNDYSLGGAGAGYFDKYGGLVSTDQTITVGAGGLYGTDGGGGQSGAVMVWWEE